MAVKPHLLSAAATWEDLVTIWVLAGGGHLHLREHCQLRDPFSTVRYDIPVSHLVDGLRTYEDESPWLRPCSGCSVDEITALTFRAWPDASNANHPLVAITCARQRLRGGSCGACRDLAAHLEPLDVATYRTEEGHVLAAGPARSDLLDSLAIKYATQLVTRYDGPITPDLLKAAWVTRTSPETGASQSGPGQLHFDVAAAVLEPAAA